MQVNYIQNFPIQKYIHITIDLGKRAMTRNLTLATAKIWYIPMPLYVEKLKQVSILF